MGSSNKLAYVAAHAVSDRPGVNHSNPLFIYGDLAWARPICFHAIAHGLKQNYPDAKVVYIKGDDFTNELVASIRREKRRIPGEIPPGDTAAGGRRAVHRR